MTSWPSKDADAVLDYHYTIPLDSGDSVVSYTFAKLSGDVVIDSHGRSGADVTAWLSGGTNGETAVFQIAWATTDGREDDDIITLLIADHEALAAPSGYVDATAAQLKVAFSKFSAVADDVVEFWLERARRMVDTSWTEGDYGMGQMLLACHYMTIEGLGTGTEAQIAAEGLGDFTSVKSGSFSFTRKDGGDMAAAGTLPSTSYGRQWRELAKANRGGARITNTGALPDVSLFPERQILTSG